MWVTDLMEIGFASAMLVMVADLGRRYYGRRRQYVVGGIAVAALLLSLADFLVNLPLIPTGGLQTSPVSSVLASLYTVDRLGSLVILTILVVGILAAAYSAFFLDSLDNAGPFFALILLLVTATLGVVAAGDFLTLFLFWEVMSVCAYGLVAFRRSEVSLEASMKYLFLAGSGSLLFLFGVAVTYSVNGSILLSALPGVIASGGQVGLLGVLMILIGLGVEAAIFPLHTWLPDAYGASSPATSAILGGVVTGIAAFALLKVLRALIPGSGALPATVVNLQTTLVAIAVLTMLVGNFGALGQDNLRRMLGFSSISQVGYMVAALATFSPLGFTAVVFQIWNHGLVKSNFFMLTGTAGRDYDAASMDAMGGSGQRDKPLGVMYASSALAMVGSPPFGMFWSELLIVQSILSVGTALFYGLAAVLVLNIFLSIAYYFRVINKVVLNPETQPQSSASRRLLLAPALLLGLSILTGIIPALILGIVS